MKKNWRQKHTEIKHQIRLYKQLSGVLFGDFCFDFSSLQTLKTKVTRPTNDVEVTFSLSLCVWDCECVKCNFGVLKLTPTLWQVTDFVN